MKYLSAIIVFAATACLAAAPSGTPRLRLLRDDARISIAQADGAEFFAGISRDEELEFKLECSALQRWQVRSTKPAMVSVSSEVKRKSGIWWQEFEIEGRRRGESVLLFTFSDGKVMTLRLKID